jgi:hypothetical protein
MVDVESLEARPADVSFTLDWLAEDGALKGALQARNVSRRRVRLTGKPQLSVIGNDGNPLEALTVMTLELRMPGYVELDPGETAVSRIGWAGWDGPAASARVLVSWPGGQTEVLASGPFQPAGTGPATNLWSSWFSATED